MADKSIGELPVAQQLDDESLLVVEQQGEARSIQGVLVKGFAQDSVSQYVDSAKASAEAAVTAGAAATESAEQAAASAETAQQYSGNPPQIGEDGTWETWDAESGTYTDTNKPSRGVQGEQGEPGVSPTVSINKAGKTTTVTITDAQGEHQFEIQDGLDGTGAGDMTKAVYDPQNHERDIFQYVDDAVKNVKITTDDEVTQESGNPVKSSGIYKALQNVKIELDPGPMPDSEKAVQSGGVYTALQSKADLGEDGKLKPEQLPDNIDAATLGGNKADHFATATALDGKQDKLTFDEAPTEGSENPVKSGGVWDATRSISLEDIDTIWEEAGQDE